MLRGLASTYIPGTPAESPMPLWDVKSRNRLEEGELTLEFHSSSVNHAIPCVPSLALKKKKKKAKAKEYFFFHNKITMCLFSHMPVGLISFRRRVCV